MQIFQKVCSTFGEMKLIYKLLLLYAAVFTIITLSVGLTYSASVRMMTTETHRFTEQITEQLKISMQHALKTIDNQLFNNYNLRVLIGGNIEALSTHSLTAQERLRYKLRMGDALNEFVYINQWVRWAAIIDVNDIAYIGTRAGGGINYDVDAHIAGDKASAQAAHGGTIWQSCGDGTVLVKRMLYNWNSMQYTGYVLVNLDGALFDTALKDISHLNNGSITVLDSSRRSIFCMPANTKDVSDYYISIMDEQNGGNFSYNGKWYMVLSQQISKENLVIMNIIDVSRSTEALRHFTRQYVLICIFCLCFISLITLVVVRSIGKNIRIIMSGIDDIAVGKFDTQIIPKGGAEFAQIADNINIMTMRISNLLQKSVMEESFRQQANYQLLESQYNALQAQINPHFMFNALESISGIAKINDDIATSDLVCRLARLLRTNLERTDKFCPLYEEVKYILDYLEFYQAIYPGKITINNRIDDCFSSIPVPTFLLQPVVENAIVHGIGRKIGMGTLVLSSKKENDVFVLSVSDDGPGIPKEKLRDIFTQSDASSAKKRMGIRNVNDRVKMLYGKGSGVYVESHEGQGTRVDIHLSAEYPQKKEGANVFGSDC